MQSLSTFLVICIAVIKANECESDTRGRENFKFLAKEADSVLLKSSRVSQTVPLFCGIKNVTKLTGIVDTKNSRPRIQSRLEICYLDYRTLLFKTDGFPKLPLLTHNGVYQMEEVVVAILCLSSSPILFMFEGDLPQWDLIFEHDYDPKKEIYLSTIHIPYVLHHKRNNHKNILYSSEFLQRDDFQGFFGFCSCAAKNRVRQLQEFDAKVADRAKKFSTSPPQCMPDDDTVSDNERFPTNKVFPVDKRWNKPIRQPHSRYKNKTQAAKASAIQRTISEALFPLDPNSEIEQTMVGSMLQQLFSLFQLVGELDVLCSCSAHIGKGRKKVFPLNAKIDDVMLAMEQARTPWILYVTGFVNIALAVSVVGSLLYKRHMRKKETPTNAQHQNHNIVDKDIGEQTIGTEIAKIKSKPKNETTIWISPQPLELLSTTPLGSGYYGKVYKVQHTLLEEPMAIKHILLYKALQACSWNVDLLLREIKHLRQVQHPNVVKFYHCWIEGPEGMVGLVESMGISQWTSTNDNYSFFIQMEFCDGTLDGWLKNKERQGQDENITSIFRQVLQGLDAIHRKDIVHRDIKPNNIFWKMEGNAKKIWKLGDLGLSKKMGVDSENSKNSDEDDELSHVGNENYKSPEMSRELNYTYKTDIYSLGLVFLEILLPELINTGKKVAVFKEIRESENLGSYLLLLLGSPGCNKKENCIPKNETLYTILEGMLNSVPEFRNEIHAILKLLED